MKVVALGRVCHFDLALTREDAYLLAKLVLPACDASEVVSFDETNASVTFRCPFDGLVFATHVLIPSNLKSSLLLTHLQ